MIRKRSLPGFDDRSPPDRYCDLVLTGGVTSAIAYPGIVFGLGQSYRFNAIGGSSSGAGSAALAAAAEYRRRQGSSAGFDTLLRRTAEVADEIGGRTGLAWLFQPDPWSRRLFKALLPAFAGPSGRAGSFVRGLVGAYRGFAVLGFVLGLVLVLAGPLLVGTQGWVAWGLLALVIGLLSAAATVAGELWADIRRAADADYGLCSGQLSEPHAQHLPLTAWLHELIQETAGLPHERPLTFADLWAAPGGPRDTLGDTSPAGARSIDLRMFSANLSLVRPLLLPQGEEEPALYFRPSEMRRLFPAAVVAFMKSRSVRFEAPLEVCEPRRQPPAKGCRALWHSLREKWIGPGSAAPPPAGATADRGDRCDCGNCGNCGACDDDFYPLPRAELPVLVASRMSVSFPVLFSAVPLWQLDGAGRRMRRLLFADGGLCSNFPIHLFDSPVPAWPTFGVALHEDGGEAPEPVCTAAWVHVPDEHRQPPPDRWRPWDQDPRPLDRLLGFAMALVSTTKDWNDALLAELPGVRERIAQIALPAKIGGLNILMCRSQIEWLAMAGAEAARQLLERFSAPAAGSAVAPGWREHRWVRFNVLAECLHESVEGLSRAVHFSRYAEPLHAQIRQAVTIPPLAGEGARTLRPAEAAALERMLGALLAFERELSPRPLEQPYRPLPRPQLRIRPPM